MYKFKNNCELILDKNECNIAGSCVNAACVNFDGGYNCTCNTGFKYEQGSTKRCEGKFC